MALLEQFSQNGIKGFLMKYSCDGIEVFLFHSMTFYIDIFDSHAEKLAFFFSHFTIYCTQVYQD